MIHVVTLQTFRAEWNVSKIVYHTEIWYEYYLYIFCTIKELTKCVCVCVSADMQGREGKIIQNERGLPNMSERLRLVFNVRDSNSLLCFFFPHYIFLARYKKCLFFIRPIQVCLKWEEEKENTEKKNFSRTLCAYVSMYVCATSRKLRTHVFFRKVLRQTELKSTWQNWKYETNVIRNEHVNLNDCECFL